MKTYNEIFTHLLKVLGKLNCITHDQCIKFFTEDERKEVVKALDWLKLGKLIISQNVLVPAAGENSLKPEPGRTAQVKVYFLSVKGKNFIKKHKPDWARFTKTGEPSGQRKQCLYHDLLVVESLIWWYQNDVVIDFLSESEARSMGRNLADLTVLIEQNGCKVALDSEIVVQNSCDDIDTKSNDMMFFTPSQYQSDIITSRKKTVPVIVNLTAFKRTQPINLDRISYDDQELIEAICYPRSAECVADFIGKDRAQTQSRLNKLAVAGLISVGEVHLEPGKSKGRRAKIYAKKETDIRLLGDRIFWFLASKLQIDQSKKGFCIGRIDKKQNCLSFSDTQNRPLFYVEDADLSLDENIKQFKKLQSFLPDRNYVPANEDNLKLIRFIEPSIKTLDLISQKAKK